MPMVQQVKAATGTEDFHTALSRYDRGDLIEAGPAGCDSDKCLLPEKKPD
jgi:ribonucleotide reductase class II